LTKGLFYVKIVSNADMGGICGREKAGQEEEGENFYWTLGKWLKILLKFACLTYKT